MPQRETFQNWSVQILSCRLDKMLNPSSAHPTISELKKPSLKNVNLKRILFVLKRNDFYWQMEINFWNDALEFVYKLFYGKIPKHVQNHFSIQHTQFVSFPLVWLSAVDPKEAEDMSLSP